MQQILVTNDDGVEADGLAALVDTLTTLGQVTVVAPAEENSAVSHALTVRRALQLRELDDGWYSIDGTPTDCINVAVSEVLGQVPDLVVSGINNGLNVGDDVTYSGTVRRRARGCAARCACHRRLAPAEHRGHGLCAGGTGRQTAGRISAGAGAPTADAVERERAAPGVA